MQKNRPDFSRFVVHFTKGTSPFIEGNENPVNEYKSFSAKERLISILKKKKIIASKMPWTNTLAVCFTECPWSSLLQHVKNYSSYGIGFDKSHLFAAGGAPALYVREDLYQSQQWDSRVHPFVTPFAPAYRSKKIKDKSEKFKDKDLDYTHEREWRVVHDFSFEYKQIKFIVVENTQDIEEIIKKIPMLDKKLFLSIEMYKKIEQLWPTHILD